MREQQLLVITNILDQIAGDARTDERVRITEYYGLAGIGKSYLLGQVKEEVRRRKLPFATVDFAGFSEVDTTAVQLLNLLCDQLDHEISTFGMRSTLAGKEPGQELSTQFLAELLDALTRRSLVLIFDSTERCSQSLFDWIGRELIGRLSEEDRLAGLAVFAAGRVPSISESTWPMSAKRKTLSLPIEAFGREDTEQQIAETQSRRQYRKAGREIHALSNGHPYSTKSLVEWLDKCNIDEAQVGQYQHHLAEQLQDDVIGGYVLAHAEDWMLGFVAKASVLRRFDASMLRQLMDDQHSVTWYIQRLADLQDQSLHLVEFGDTEPAYYLEPTLAKLLRTIQAILQPEATITLHQSAKTIWEGKLANRVSARFALEAVYHAAQIATIGGTDACIAAKNTLDQLLVAYFKPVEYERALSELRDFIAKDHDLEVLVGKECAVDLASRVVKHVRIRKSGAVPFEFTHLIIDHRPPNEYSVTWYAMDQVLLPTEVIRSPRQFPLEKWQNEPEAVGKAAFASYLPRRAQEFVRSRRDWAIQITTDWMDIPWELLHDGEDFLCLSRPIARKPKMLKEPASSTVRWTNRALVVGNPTGDLLGAEAEARTIAKLLAEQGMDVTLLVGPQEATATEFQICLTSSAYDLIHYAGHGQFDAGAPHLSTLLFLDGPYFAEELERSLQGAPFVFLSACEAGQAQTSLSSAGYQGRFVDGLAAAALMGGASGCLGPIWEIGDGVAKEFALAFYGELLGGQPIGEAVREARLATRNLSTDFWAAWILYGDPFRKLGAINERAYRPAVTIASDQRLRAWRDLVSRWQLQSEAKDLDRFDLLARELCSYIERYAGLKFVRQRIDPEQAEPLAPIDFKKVGMSVDTTSYNYLVAFTERPEWELSLPERVPFMVVLADSVQDEQFRQIGAAVGQAGGDTTLVYVLAPAFSPEMKARSRQGKVLLDIDDISALVAQGTLHLKSGLETVTRERVDLRLLSPYQTEGTIKRRELYFGRDAELRQILRHIKERSHFLLGRRRSGKTSALHVIRKELDTEAGPGIISFWSGLDGCENQNDLRSRLQIDTDLQFHDGQNGEFGLTLVHAINRYAIDHDCHVVLMWDEVDRLIDHDTKAGWPFFRTLRAEAQRPDARFSLLVTGFPSLYRETRDKDSPLYNFGDVITLQRLDKMASRKLVLEPMTALGIRVTEDAVIGIHDICSGDPYLMQGLCHEVVQEIGRMPAEALEVDENLVTEIVKGQKFVTKYLDANYTWLPLKSRLFILHALYQEDPTPIVDERKVMKSMRLRKSTASMSLEEVMNISEFLLGVGNVLAKRDKKLVWDVKHLPDVLRQNLDLDLQIEREEEELNADTR